MINLILLLQKKRNETTSTTTGHFHNDDSGGDNETTSKKTRISLINAPRRIRRSEREREAEITVLITERKPGRRGGLI